MGTPIVTAVKVLRPYLIDVTFGDGVHRQIDLASYLKGEVFEPLRDPELFAQATVDPVWRTVVWPNGADLAPEFLYEERPVGAAGESEVDKQSKPRKARKRATHANL